MKLQIDLSNTENKIVSCVIFIGFIVAIIPINFIVLLLFIIMVFMVGTVINCFLEDSIEETSTRLVVTFMIVCVGLMFVSKISMYDKQLETEEKKTQETTEVVNEEEPVLYLPKNNQTIMESSWVSNDGVSLTFFEKNNKSTSTIDFKEDSIVIIDFENKKILVK